MLKSAGSEPAAVDAPATVREMRRYVRRRYGVTAGVHASVSADELLPDVKLEVPPKEVMRHPPFKKRQKAASTAMAAAASAVSEDPEAKAKKMSTGSNSGR